MKAIDSMSEKISADLMIIHKPYEMSIYISSLKIGKGFIQIILFDQIGDSIHKGSKKFCQGILQELNLDLTVKSWNMEVCRTDFFSDYIGEEDWTDNWQIVWQLKIDTVETNIKKVRLPDVFIESDIDDDSWASQERVTDESISQCLVIGNFLNQGDRNKAIGKISENYLKADTSDAIKKPVFLKSKVLDKYFQIVINLGSFPPDFYSQGAAYAKAIEKICKESGGLVHYSLLE
jgi:hypothetical protein